MKKGLFIGWLLFSFAAFAAEGDSTQTKNEAQEWSFATAQKRIKFSPFELFSAVPTLSVDLDMEMKEGIRLQGGFGLIPSFMQPSSGGLSEQQFNWMGGYKMRAESKFFVLRKPNRYISTELTFRHLLIRDNVSIGMEGDGNGNFAYFMDERMTFNRFNTQFAFKWGFEKEWDSGFLIDFYTGLAARQVFVQSGQPEANGEVMGDWNAFNWSLVDNHKMSYVTPIFGLRLGFKIK